MTASYLRKALPDEVKITLVESPTLERSESARQPFLIFSAYFLISSVFLRMSGCDTATAPSRPP